MRWRLAIAAAAALAGCGERAFIQYQGRDAQTALECDAGYEAAKEQASSTPVVVPGGAAGLVAVALTAGAIGANREEAYRQCLARVATLPTGSVGATSASPAQSFNTASPAPVAPRPDGCAAGAGPFQGGTGYCVGR
jgi:hypothetical protein